MNISLEQARTLFQEAYDWEMGYTKFMPENSPIRKIALDTFGRQAVQHLDAVCNEIFKVIAINCMNGHPE